MTTVASTLKMFDAMSRPLQNITSSMNMMISTMQRMQETTTRDVKIDRTLVAAKKQIVSAEVDIKKAIEDAARAQDKFRNSAQNSKKQVGDLLETVRNVTTAYLSFQGIKSGIGLVDDYTNTNARLNLVNDNLQTTKELQDKIFASAERARGSYFDMAAVIGKMGILASEAFGSNDELISFTELMTKSFRVGGASTMEQQAGMYQLSQAMAAGKLQGDEFRSIMENAPMLADAIAKYTGKTKGDLKDMSADGVITADIIKGAMFAAADDINNKFAQMPKTFGDYFNLMKNRAVRQFAPLMERINALLNSSTGTAFFNAVEKGIVIVSSLLSGFINGLIWMGDVIQYNWPIIAGILAGIGVYLAVMAYQQIPLLIVKLWGMVAPVLAQAAAWLAIKWPIVLVAAAIALVVAALVHFGVSTQEVVGFVIGVFYALYARIYNYVGLLWNLFASYAEFLINLFIDPVYAIKKLFYDLAMTFGGYMYNMALSVEDFAGTFVKAILKSVNKAIEGFNWLADTINSTFGTDIGKMALLDEDNVNVVSDSLKKILDMIEEPVSDKDVVSLARMEYKNLNDSFNSGYSAGYNFTDNALNKLGSFAKGMPTAGGALGTFGAGDGTIPNIDKVKKVGKIEDKVDISSEDLKTMRELAEMKSIQNFVTLTPTVSVSTGDINTGEDLDSIMARITATLEEEIASSSSRIYE